MSLQREILSPVTTAGMLYETENSSSRAKSRSSHTSYPNCDAEHGGERITEPNSVQCLVCGKHLKGITNSHLKKHNITVEQYRKMFGNSMWKSRVPWNKGLTKTDERVKRNIESTKRSIFNKYGVLNASQIPEVREKIKQSLKGYGLGIPKPGTSQKLKGKPKSLEHRRHISEAVKKQYKENPKRREISVKSGCKAFRKIVGRTGSPPQRKLYQLVKSVFPEAKYNYEVKITKNHYRYLDVAVPSLKIDFEYDGVLHEILPDVKENDKTRTAELEQRGWKIIRFNKLTLRELEQGHQLSRQILFSAIHADGIELNNISQAVR